MKDMKRILSILFAGALFPGFAANLIPNGDLMNPAGEKPYLRKFMKGGKDSPNLKTSFVVKEDGGSILLESSEADGIAEVNYSRLPGVEAGKKYYLCYQFTPVSFGARCPDFLPHCVF